MKFLPAHAFRRYDESDDAIFYQTPRFVAHIEPETIAAVTQLYRELLPPNGAILDLMSSWISHYPPEMQFSRVVGLGMSHEELAANPILNGFAVQNLNQNPILPYENEEFDAAIICVSVQYLTQPVEVLQDLKRVLKPSAPVIISFSNRCFPTKAVVAWQALDDAGHLELVASYLEAAGWKQIERRDCTPTGAMEPLLAVVARK
ncbi:MAG TPA: methyltransferase domain-containing protein [Abditibacterium sp.]